MDRTTEAAALVMAERGRQYRTTGTNPTELEAVKRAGDEFEKYHRIPSEESEDEHAQAD